MALPVVVAAAALRRLQVSSCVGVGCGDVFFGVFRRLLEFKGRIQAAAGVPALLFLRFVFGWCRRACPALLFLRLRCVLACLAFVFCGRRACLALFFTAGVPALFVVFRSGAGVPAVLGGWALSGAGVPCVALRFALRCVCF